jgi:hypothetical protein
MSKTTIKSRALAKQCFTKIQLCGQVKPKENEKIVISSTWHYAAS